MNRIAVLLTVHNRREKTIKCLDCLYSCSVPKGYTFDVYMTDDGCIDGTPDAVRDKYPDVHIIQGDGNLFWTRGMFEAWEEAAKYNYDYYLWLNDDTFLFSNSLVEALQCAELTGSMAIIAGATRSEVGQCTYGLRDLQGKLIVPNGELQRSEGYLNGNYVLVPRYVYQEIGNFDPYYIHAGGDVEYGLVAREMKIPVYLARNYIGICEGHPTLPKCFNPDVPLMARLKSLNEPTGMPLKVLFYSENRHFGFCKALFHVITTILHCMMPSIWGKMKK